MVHVKFDQADMLFVCAETNGKKNTPWM